MWRCPLLITNAVARAMSRDDTTALLTAVRELCDCIANTGRAEIEVTSAVQYAALIKASNNMCAMQGALSSVFSPLATALNHSEVEVRKVVVLALVNLYLVVGATLDLHLSELTETQVRHYMRSHFKHASAEQLWTTYLNTVAAVASPGFLVCKPNLQKARRNCCKRLVKAFTIAKFGCRTHRL
jgi:hypothetical protein